MSNKIKSGSLYMSNDFSRPIKSKFSGKNNIFGTWIEFNSWIVKAKFFQNGKQFEGWIDRSLANKLLTISGDMTRELLNTLSADKTHFWRIGAPITIGSDVYFDLGLHKFDSWEKIAEEKGEYITVNPNAEIYKIEVDENSRFSAMPNNGHGKTIKNRTIGQIKRRKCLWIRQLWTDNQALELMTYEDANALFQKLRSESFARVY